MADFAVLFDIRQILLCFQKGKGNIMLHPSYTDLMQLVNSEVESGEAPVVNSRYSIVLATSKRARQLIDGVQPMVKSKCPKPLSIAIEELKESKIHILSEEEAAQIEEEKAREAALKSQEAESFLSFEEE
jgi:DNA-directed RNA polymerase subunit omega